MLILWKAKARNADGGYATTFLTQMEQVLGTCVDRGIKVVTNAGGLNPAGCADEGAGDRRAPRRHASHVAHIEGDDLMDRIDGLRPHLDHLDTGAPLTADPVSANAYLGGWGIAARPRRGRRRRRVPAGHRRRASSSARRRGGGAGRRPTGTASPARSPPATSSSAGRRRPAATSPSSASSPRPVEAARVPDRRGRRRRLGRDHQAPGHRRRGHRRHRHGPAAVRDRTAGLRQPRRRHPLRHDPPRPRSAPTGCASAATRGEPAPPTTKVAINYDGGFRNRMTFVLTGLDQEAKAAWADRRPRRRRWAAPSGSRDAGVTIETPFRAGAERRRRPGALQRAAARVRSRRPTSGPSGGRSRRRRSSWPWPASPGSSRRRRPGRRTSYGVYWPALVPADEIDQVVVLDDGTRLRIDPAPTGPPPAEPIEPPMVDAAPATIAAGHAARRRTSAPAPATRAATPTSASGPATTPATPGWRPTSPPSGSASCSPRPATAPIHRYELPNLRALNFVLVGYLGEGVASSTVVRPPGQGPRRVPPLPPGVTGPSSSFAIGPIGPISTDRSEETVEVGELERHEVGPVLDGVRQVLDDQAAGVAPRPRRQRGALGAGGAVAVEDLPAARASPRSRSSRPTSAAGSAIATSDQSMMPDDRPVVDDDHVLGAEVVVLQHELGPAPGGSGRRRKRSIAARRDGVEQVARSRRRAAGASSTQAVEAGLVDVDDSPRRPGRARPIARISAPSWRGDGAIGAAARSRRRPAGPAAGTPGTRRWARHARSLVEHDGVGDPAAEPPPNQPHHRDLAADLPGQLGRRRRPLAARTIHGPSAVSTRQARWSQPGTLRGDGEHATVAGARRRRAGPPLAVGRASRAHPSRR